MSEIQKATTDEADPSSLRAPAEALVQRPRFVVFGSRISGAYGAATAFEDHLTHLGLPDPEVTAVRDAAYIDAAFYDRTDDEGRLALEAPKAKTGPARISLRRKIANLLLGSEVEATPEAAPDVPAGVIVFPQMRQYYDGRGMFIPSPREYIQDLCDKNRVPVIFMEDVQTPADFEASVANLAHGFIASTPQLPRELPS